ncbi:hypothetical protein JD969_05690 [Planctomycetota bacterium]|nr:hypothetical protein JD969_05690 [Planctomycetota bacterium]
MVAFTGLGIVVLLLPVVFGGFGFYWLAKGWRGKKVDDHPVCRKCRYDLIGVCSGELDALWGQACSECGKWLHNEKDIRIGNRQRSKFKVVLGLISFVICLSIIGGAGYSITRNVGFKTFLPTWYLKLEANYPALLRYGDSSLNVLCYRIQYDLLSKEQISDLVDDAIDAIDGPARLWVVNGNDASWGDVFIEAAVMGKVSVEQTEKYLDAMMRHAVWRRPTYVLPESEIQLALDSPLDRRGLTQRFGPKVAGTWITSQGGVEFLFSNSRSKLGKHRREVKKRDYLSGDYIQYWEGFFLWDIADEGERVELGIHDLEWTITAECRIDVGGKKRTLAKKDFVFRDKIEVVDKERGLELIKQVKTEEAAKGFVNSVKKIEIKPGGFSKSLNKQEHSLNIIFATRLHGFAYECYMVLPNNEEIYLNEFICDKGDNEIDYLRNCWLDPKKLEGVETVDLLMKPNRELAYRHVGLMEIVGEEVLIEDIEIQNESDGQ